MNERRSASQIRFVFQSFSGHIPYWLKPNNLIRRSPPPFSSSRHPSLLRSPPPFLLLFFLLTVPKEKRLAPAPLFTIKEALTANHSSWPQSWAFNFDDIYQSWQGYQIKKKKKEKKKDWLCYISDPRLKDITLQHTHQSGESVKRTRGLGGENNLASWRH